MNIQYFEDKTFEKVDFSITSLSKGEYENCTFSNCNFAELHLSGYVFSECTFKDCNLSMTLLRNTSLKNIRFVSCKLLGVHFEQCNQFLFEVNFQHCQLNLSTFQGLNLKKTVFNECMLHETDFSDADLVSAVFNNCDLTRTLFSNTNLEKADFRTSFNYSIHPETNRIKKARFSKEGLIGLLDRYGIIID